jgi:flagellar protein FlbD
VEFQFRPGQGLRERKGHMIQLTRLGGEAFVLNPDLIRCVVSRPETFITLVSGDRVVVQETMNEVLERAVQYQQAKHESIGPPHPRAIQGDGPTAVRA